MEADIGEQAQRQEHRVDGSRQSEERAERATEGRGGSSRRDRRQTVADLDEGVDMTIDRRKSMRAVKA